MTTTITTTTTTESSSSMTALTTTSALDASTAHRNANADRPAIRTRRDDAVALPATLRSEWIKFWSIRSNPAILALTAIIGVAMSMILATLVKTDPYTDETFTIVHTFIVSTWFSAILAAITGTLLFTSEVQHGTLANSIAAQPARWVTVGAKVTLAAGFGFVLAATGMIAGLGGAVLGGLDTGDTTGITSTVLWGLLLPSLAAIFGLGVGMIIRHSAAAISILLVWAFVVENIIRSVAPANFSRLLPFSAANGLLGLRSAGDTPATLAAALSRPQDAVVFAAYSVGALVAGTVLLYRQDTA